MSNSSTVSLSGGCLDVAPDNFCIYGRKNNDVVIYTIHSSAKGWASIALGDGEMAGSDFYIGWKVSSGNILSRRGATGFKMPTPSQNQIATIVPLEKPAPSWATIAYSFSRPITSDNTVTSTSKYMYAYSDSVPKTVDDPNSMIEVHNEAGVVNGNFNFLCTGASCTESSLKSGHHCHGTSACREQPSSGGVMKGNGSVELFLILFVFIWNYIF